MRPVGTILLALVILCGCAGTPQTTRVVELTEGEFYTNDEIKALSEGERDQYCAALTAEIDRLRGEAVAFMASADSIALLSDSLKMVNAELTTEIRDLDGEVRQLRLARRSTTTYVVKAGDTLQNISSMVYGESSRWRDIYLANKELIGEANTPLKVGTSLKIPAK